MLGSRFRVWGVQAGLKFVLRSWASYLVRMRGSANVIGKHRHVAKHSKVSFRSMLGFMGPI